ncbi:hypothetical protein HPQ64_06905 [Rhizobiales bacterium]|uniref:hypothetical protein n=1 Tax=Hongsoonwoonella zoysiae TaxID=2821844 RepID=UPI001560AB95|nr:hypothetical protein [Hongsoonwoonella zoysiae]NRG17410.1 hypothetical protein [Hongsoonwoonella zoysiae]
MIEVLMYGALGFFVAGLISVAIIPAVWRRAVRLTHQAIEATSPLSASDARAEMSALRAQHAVACCKLEKRLEGLYSELAENRIERDRSEAHATAMKQERDASARMLDEAAARNEELHQKITSLESDLARANGIARNLQRELDLKTKREAVRLARSQPANESEAPPSALSPAESGNDEHDESLTEEIAASANAAAITKIATLELENASLTEKLRKVEAKLREADTATQGSREIVPADKAARDKQKALENKIFDMETRYIAAQAEITRLNLQLERLEDNASGLSYDMEDGDLKTRIAVLEEENASLRQVLGGGETSGLREALKDIAARITAQLADDADLAALKLEKEYSDGNARLGTLARKILAARKEITEKTVENSTNPSNIAAHR